MRTRTTMKQIYLTLALCFAAVSAFAQYDATITVTDLGSGSPLENANVTLDGNTLPTDVAGQATFVGLADNTYDYTVSALCYTTTSGMITIDGANAFAPVSLEAMSTNNLFFFIGSPLALIGAHVQITDGMDYNASFTTSSPWGGEMIEGVPFGEISYTITTPCYETVSGTVTVDCNNGDGIAVFAEPAEATTNNLFFFIGSPLALTGAHVQITDGMDYNASFTTSSPWGGEMIEGVPFGEISYTITTPCYETVSGTVTVDCNNGDGIAVFAEPAEATTNNLFFFIGSPLALTGAHVQITDGMDYNASFTTSSPWGGEMIEGVPFGEISYTITTPCYETVSGTVTVDCNNGDGIAVFAEPAEATTNNLFFFIGSPLALIGAHVQITDGMDYNASFTTSSPWGGEMIEGVPFGEISYTITTPCYETVSGTVTVDCNNGDGIAVFAEPAGIDLGTEVTLIGNTLTATTSDMDYQWVDCDNGNAPIDGADGQSFEATENGNYAVIITSGDCAQTSACTMVTVTGTNDLAGRDAFTVYPNPFNEQLVIRTTGLVGPVRVELFSAAGQLYIDETSTAVELINVNTAQLAPGSYVVRLTATNARNTLKVVK